MKVSSKRLRRGGALIGIAGAGALMALGSAGAYVGGVGSGPLVTTNVPDLRTVTITSTANPNDAFGPTAQWCFDAPIATIVAFNSLRISEYDSASGWAPTGAQLNNQKPECVDATYANGSDIEQGSFAFVFAGSVQGVGGTNTPDASVPVTGSKVAPIAGHTEVPELINASVVNNTEIVYTFDEKLDPAFNTPAAFGYYQNTQNGATPTTGTAVVLSGATARVTFAAAITSAVQFVVFPNGGTAVRDTPNFFPGSGNTIGNAGTQINGSPGLVSAAKDANNQSVVLTFSQAVNPQTPAGVVAYREDGQQLAPTTSISTTDDSQNLKLLATLPTDAQDDPGSVVRIAVGPAAASARSDNTATIRTVWSAAAIGTCKCTPGYSDGPDLMSTTINDATNRIDYVYDEEVQDGVTPAANAFRALQPDGTAIAGQDGVIVSSDRKTVQVHFASSVSATVGVAMQGGTVNDNATNLLNGSSVNSVGKGAVQQGQTGTVPTPTATATVTAQPTVTVAPTVTVTPGPTTVRRSSRISISRRSRGRRFSGRVTAGSPCRSGRTVRLLRGSRRIASTRTSSSGRYSFRVRRQRKGRIRAQVTARTVTQGTTRFLCGRKTSKRV